MEAVVGTHLPATTRWEDAAVWLSDRSRSAATRLARDGSTSVTAASRELHRAQRLADMPNTAGAPRPDQAGKLFCSTTTECQVRLDGWLDPIGGAAVTTELRRLTRELVKADRVAGVQRTPAQRRAAALVEMAMRSASTPAGAQRPRPLISVLVGVEAWTRTCELANGTVVGADQLVPLLRWADIESMLFDTEMRPLATSKRRTFVDHVVPWTDGGPTAAWNGALLCSTHNRRADRQPLRHHPRQVPPPSSSPAMPGMQAVMDAAGDRAQRTGRLQIIHCRLFELPDAGAEPA